MHAQHDDTDTRTMILFLLDALDDAERTRVKDRLADDASYFDEVAALEDELLLAWHQRRLSREGRARFAAAYLGSAARRRRVDETKALIAAARIWRRREKGLRWWTLRRRLASSARVPPFAFAAAAVVALSLAAYLASDLTRLVREASWHPFGSQARVVAFTLTAAGERARGAAASLDRLRIPPETSHLRLSLEIAPRPAGARLEAALIAVDGDTMTQPSSPAIKVSTAAATATVTVQAPPDGDYLLIVRRITGTESSLAATQAFRVTRSARALGK